MGQFTLHGPQAAAALERLVPATSKPQAGRQRYTLLLNEAGGIQDDLMVTNYGTPLAPNLLIVANASRKDSDATPSPKPSTATPSSSSTRTAPSSPSKAPTPPPSWPASVPKPPPCPSWAPSKPTSDPSPPWISRSGYSGEDGFEISVPADQAETLAEHLLAEPGVLPAASAPATASAWKPASASTATTSTS